MGEIKKIKKNPRQFRLSESIDAKLDALAAETGKSRTLIVEEALEYYIAKDQIKELSDDIIKKFDEKYGNSLTRIRLGVNTADINSQILIELANSILQFQGYKKDVFTSTSVMENPVVTSAKDDIRDKIAKLKQARDHKRP